MRDDEVGRFVVILIFEIIEQAQQLRGQFGLKEHGPAVGMFKTELPGMQELAVQTGSPFAAQSHRSIALVRLAPP